MCDRVNDCLDKSDESDASCYPISDTKGMLDSSATTL